MLISNAYLNTSDVTGEFPIKFPMIAVFPTPSPGDGYGNGHYLHQIMGPQRGGPYYAAQSGGWGFQANTSVLVQIWPINDELVRRV